MQRSFADTPRPDAVVASAPGSRIDVRTNDTGEFIATVNALFGPHRFVGLGADGLRGSVQGQRVGELVAGRLNYGTDAHVVVEDVRDAWVLTHPVGADGAWDGERFSPDELMMYAPEWRGRLDMNGRTWMRNIAMPTATLERHLVDLLGSPHHAPLRFEQRLPVTAEAAQRLREVSSMLIGVDTQRTAPALEQAWQSTFCLEVLTSWQHNYSAVLDRVGPALPRALRRACDCIEAHLREQPDAPLRVEQIARAAAVGVRALELAFQKHLQTTPARYLREQRLQGARRELLSRSAAQRPRVADLAVKWGYANPGQFARAYRERFGELPGRRSR